MQSKILKWLSFGSLAAAIVLMAAATVVERLHGTEVALSRIYHHPVFFALWGVTAVAGLALLWKRGAFRKPFTLGLHLAFVLILVGALVTHKNGISGSIHLRKGIPYGTIQLDNGGTYNLPFGIMLHEFAIEYDPGTRNPADYRSNITFLPTDGRAIISMNHIAKHRGWRFYQMDYDEDLEGSILAVSYDPRGVGITYAGYILLLVSMIGFFFEKDGAWSRTLRALRRGREPDKRRRALGIVLTVAALGMLAAWMSGAFPKGPLMPVLRSPLLFLHMIPIIVSYALFGLTTLLGVSGLLVKPAASARLRDISLAILYPAVFLLTFGTFLGAVWANISWGNYWAWDPKETWALATLLIYSFALHGDALPALCKPRVFHAFCIFAFLSVLVTYFGVNFLLGGMHSYA